ncbi:ATP-dependent DNA ligase [Pseudalkalibacillus hwajinpoensis]|uniref:ATP-dependent DNA ligase n=1 Tax=Guptibacillus hwajinpoensis TaxID=208199 RepID=UPI001A7E8F16|nr:ATP-dependent DNA ligase [Pseudalkalibacillus hwajinpoensis]
MFIQPMLLQPSLPFNDSNYLTELKADGIRLIYSHFDNKVNLYSRHHNNITYTFPEIISEKIPSGTILDGELIQTDEKGKPDFESLMSRFHLANSSKIKYRSVHEPVTYLPFDILYHRGVSVMNLPLTERKQLLHELLPEDTGQIVKVRYQIGKAEELFNLCKENDLEGIVMKRLSSVYEVNKRSHSWKKAVNYHKETFFIMGQRKKKYGLLLSEETESGLRPVGVMEFVPPEARRAIYDLKTQLLDRETSEMIYFKPRLRCLVKYRNRTSNGNLRIPSFVEFDI